MVIKGPVASAGSILYFSNVRGINVPNKAAKIITANKEILTVRLSPIPYPNPNAAPNIIKEQMILLKILLLFLGTLQERSILILELIILLV